MLNVHVSMFDAYKFLYGELLYVVCAIEIESVIYICVRVCVCSLPRRVIRVTGTTWHQDLLPAAPEGLVARVCSCKPLALAPHKLRQ